MNGRIYFYLFLVSFFLLFFPVCFVNAETPTIEVNVTGTGPTYEEAKEDTVKKALQLALKQLVIVDRIVSENEVVRDRVLSTSNGYVEKYTEKTVSTNELGFSINANITVSASRIENFLGIVTGGGGEIDGSLLGQEVLRRKAQNAAVKAQSQARGEILNRLFEDFPMNAVALELKKIGLSQKNPNIVVLELEQSFKPNFIQALEETLKALSIKECEGPEFKKANRFFSRMNKTSLCPYNDPKKRNEVLARYIPPSYDSDINFAQACIAYTNPLRAKCYMLDHGEYLYKKSVNTGKVTIIGTFIDNSGQNALVNSRCIVSDRHRSNNPIYTLGMSRGARIPLRFGSQLFISSIFALSTDKLKFTIEIESSEIDLNRATQFIGVVALMQRDGVIGLTSNKEPESPCQIVDEAVRLHLLSVSQ